MNASRLLRGAFALALAVAASPAAAQTYLDRSGTIVPGVVALPYPYVPLSPGQHNLAPTSATALTVPGGARFATVCASTATVRYTTDGTTAPTSTVGMPLAAASCVALSGAAVLANFKAFSSSGTLDVEYFQ
jgi:hypothetical protein